MKRLPLDVTKFVRFVRNSCRSRKIKVRLVDSKNVSYQGMACGGWFCTDKMEIVCAIRKPIGEWLTTLTHEFCHTIQYSANSYAWRVTFTKNGEANDLIDKWLSGEEKISNRKVMSLIEKIVICERDCEDMTLRLLAENKFLGKYVYQRIYIQKANSYVISWIFVGTRRQWPKRRPYDDRKIVRVMPDSHLFTFDEAVVEARRHVPLFTRLFKD